MAALPAFSTVDLSRLPKPQVVQVLSFDDQFAALLADFQARYPEFDIPLESDPAYKLLEAFAYRIMLNLGAINDAATGTMLAYATDGDLENLAAFYGVERLTITPATDTSPAVMEINDDLRARVQLAPEILPAFGMTGGGYRFKVLTFAPTLKGVQVLKPDDGRIDLVVLGRDGDGTVTADIIAAIVAGFEAEDAAQLTDIITVRAARIVPYSPTLTVAIRSGPDPVVVQAAVIAGVQSYADQRHAIGATVYAQMLEAAASIGAVESASVDIGDVVPGADGAPWLAGLTVNVTVLR